ncbi:MAG: ADP-ribose pyrophosphatase [Syntrophorhabdus sp. PtaB.Bin184]|jgi:ADP-ribose pyrophosphatase|nr:MAG: ADP-ribose pyrophosphatase [Syntrophorhabdus sp. PtaB.Bin184]
MRDASDLKHARLIETIIENRYQSLYHMQVDLKDTTRDYYVTDYGVRAGLLVLNGNRVLLTKQYRLLLNDYSLEIPGGKVEENEMPEDAAIRECFEETGVLCSRLNHLVSYNPSLDNLFNPTHIFLSSNFEVTDKDYLNEGEVVGCRWLDLEECFRMISSSEISDTFTMIAVFAYLHRIQQAEPIHIKDPKRRNC